MSVAQKDKTGLRCSFLLRAGLILKAAMVAVLSFRPVAGLTLKAQTDAELYSPLRDGRILKAKMAGESFSQPLGGHTLKVVTGVG